MSTKLYINEIRCIVSDLKEYGVDVLSENAAHKFLSHICFNNFPPPLRMEFVRKLDCNYPTLEDIFEHYVSVIRTLGFRGNLVSKSSPNVQSKTEVNLSKMKPLFSGLFIFLTLYLIFSGGPGCGAQLNIHGQANSLKSWPSSLFSW